MKTARYIVVGAVIFWILHEITFIIYYNHTLSPMAGVSDCVITNAFFSTIPYYYFYACSHKHLTSDNYDLI